MPITLPHFVGLMSHPRIDQPLIDGTGGAVGCEGVPEDVPAPELCPLAALQRTVEMVMYFVPGGDRWIDSFGLAPGDEELLAENLHAARMAGKPLPQDLSEER